MFSKATLVVVAASLFAYSKAHMIMNTPVPYGYHDLQTSPLNGTGFNFPCQSGSRADWDTVTEMNKVTAGGSQLVKFTGSAVHGGGSCQFSVTYENPPPEDPSKWKVLHTIIGGCPAEADGNLNDTGTFDADGRPDGLQCGNDSGTECVRQFDIPIPKELKNGKATFAWTWFNNIGNREIYMNCAPLEISGGSDDTSYYDALPEMFVANYPGKCETEEGILPIPNPGDSVSHLQTPLQAALGGCAAGGSSGGASTPVASSPAASTPAASSPAPVNSGGVFAPGASSAAGASTPAPVASSPAPVASTPVASAPASTGGACANPCTEDGAVVCIGSTQFGLCDRGCAVAMDLAAGTSCKNGVISKRSHIRRIPPQARAHRRHLRFHE